MNRSRIGLLLLAVVALAALAAGASGGWAATRALRAPSRTPGNRSRRWKPKPSFLRSASAFYERLIEVISQSTSKPGESRRACCVFRTGCYSNRSVSGGATSGTVARYFSKSSRRPALASCRR